MIVFQLYMCTVQCKNRFINAFCIVCLIVEFYNHFFFFFLLKVKELREQFHKRRMKTSQASEWLVTFI